jgi:hypothetical protein
MNKYKKQFFCISPKDFFTKHRIGYFKFFFYSFIRPKIQKHHQKISICIYDNKINEIEQMQKEREKEIKISKKINTGLIETIPIKYFYDIVE